ncbi:MAG: anthranilate synthase component I, partial [Ilumatobacteraceae bacterium]
MSDGLRIHPDPAEFARLAADHSVVPVWAEILADLETPVSAYLKLVGDGPGFLLESTEHGEKWSRFSFVGRDPVATIVARGRSLEVTGSLGADVPTDRGVLAALEALLAAHSTPQVDDLPPLIGGMIGYLGYDVVREVEHLPDVPVDDHGMPDAVMSIIGSLAAFDHWRQRITLIESVMTRDEFGRPLPAEALAAARSRAADAVRASAAALSAPLGYDPVEPPRPGEGSERIRSSMP